MVSFYTRTGDDGSTGLLGEGRILKDHPITEAIGNLDESNAAIGLARAFCITNRCATLLLSIQRDLYHIMAEISATPANAEHFRKINEDKVCWLEYEIDLLITEVEIPKDFIIPGDTKTGAILDLARTFIRKAERSVVRLIQSGDIENSHLLSYLNRLSSLFFVMELFEDRAAGVVKPRLAKEE